jgi:hypothetical protein
MQVLLLIHSIIFFILSRISIVLIRILNGSESIIQWVEEREEEREMFLIFYLFSFVKFFAIFEACFEMFMLLNVSIYIYVYKMGL